MFCPNCGAKIEDGARFCAECGCPVDSLSQAAAQVQADGNYAPIGDIQQNNFSQDINVKQPKQKGLPARLLKVIFIVLGIVIAVAIILCVAAVKSAEKAEKEEEQARQQEQEMLVENVLSFKDAMLEADELSLYVEIDSNITCSVKGNEVKSGPKVSSNLDFKGKEAHLYDTRYYDIATNGKGNMHIDDYTTETYQTEDGQVFIKEDEGAFAPIESAYQTTIEPDDFLWFFEDGTELEELFTKTLEKKTDESNSGNSINMVISGEFSSYDTVYRIGEAYIKYMALAGAGPEMDRVPTASIPFRLTVNSSDDEGTTMDLHFDLSDVGYIWMGEKNDGLKVVSATSTFDITYSDKAIVDFSIPQELIPDVQTPDEEELIIDSEISSILDAYQNYADDNAESIMGVDDFGSDNMYLILWTGIYGFENGRVVKRVDFYDDLGLLGDVTIRESEDYNTILCSCSDHAYEYYTTNYVEIDRSTFEIIDGLVMRYDYADDGATYEFTAYYIDEPGIILSEDEAGREERVLIDTNVTFVCGDSEFFQTVEEAYQDYLSRQS